MINIPSVTTLEKTDFSHFQQLVMRVKLLSFSLVAIFSSIHVFIYSFTFIKYDNIKYKEVKQNKISKLDKTNQQMKGDQE